MRASQIFPAERTPIITTSVSIRAISDQSTIDLFFGRIFVTGDYGEVTCQTAVGDGNAGIRGRGDGGADAGHNFKGQSGLRQRKALFPAATEDEAIPPFQAHNLTTGLHAADEERVDLGLRHHIPLVPLFADKDALGLRPNFVQKLLGDQAVVDDDIGCPQQRQARTLIRSARPGRPPPE